MSDHNQQRGEFVLLVEASEDTDDNIAEIEAERVLRLLLADLQLKQAVSLAVEITGAKKNWVYELALTIKTESKET